MLEVMSSASGAEQADLTVNRDSEPEITPTPPYPQLKDAPRQVAEPSNMMEKVLAYCMSSGPNKKYENLPK